MTADRSIERRVARLENDRDALYELIDEFRTEIRERFSGIETTLAEHDQRFTAHDQRFTGIETTLAGHDQRFTGIETTLAEIVRRLPEPS